MEGESHGMTISRDGMISWTPIMATRDEPYSMRIQVTDICGASTTEEFRFEVKKCPCEGENGGYCKWNSTSPLSPMDSQEMICICPDGCTGLR